MTGLGTPLFDAAIKGLTDVYTAFGHCVTIDKLAPCGIVDYYLNYTTVQLSNRYFTSKQEALEDQVAFSPDVDPEGLLALAAGNRYIHTDNNIVRYYTYTQDPKGHSRFVCHQVITTC